MRAWSDTALPTLGNIGVRSSEMSEFSSEQRRRMRDRIARLARDLAERERRAGATLLKVARAVVARRLGISETRFKDILYGDARRLDPHEVETIESAWRDSQIRAAASGAVDLTAIREEIAALRRRAEQLETYLVTLNANQKARQTSRGHDRRGAGSLPKGAAAHRSAGIGRGRARSRHSGRAKARSLTAVSAALED